MASGCGLRGFEWKAIRPSAEEFLAVSVEERLRDSKDKPATLPEARP